MGEPIRYCGVIRAASGWSWPRWSAAHDVQRAPLNSTGERVPLKRPAMA